MKFDGWTFNQLVDYVKTRADKVFGTNLWQLQFRGRGIQDTFTASVICMNYTSYNVSWYGAEKDDPLASMKNLAEVAEMEFSKKFPSKDGTEVEIEGRKYKLIERPKVGYI